MPNQQLLASVKNSLENGMTREQISTQLESLGWSSSDVAEALTAASAVAPTPTTVQSPTAQAPVPAPTPATFTEGGDAGVAVTPSVPDPLPTVEESESGAVVAPVASPLSAAPVEAPPVVASVAAFTAAPVAASVSAPLGYGGFWLRVLAVFIDGLILFPINLVLVLSMDALGLQVISGLLSFLFVVLYCALLESSTWQATPGKKILGLRVTDLSGARISFLRALARYVSKILSAVIFCFGFMMVGVTKRKQGLHDKIAGTLVAKSRSAGALGIVLGLVAIALFLSLLGWTVERQVAATSTLARYASLDAMQASNLLSTQIDLEMYHASENKYPDTLNDLVGAPGVAVTQSQLQNPVTHTLNDYTVSADRQSYRLCTALSSTTTPFCVASPAAAATTTP